MQNRILLKAVARILLSADQTPDQIVLRSSETLGRRWQWLRPLVLRYLKTFAGDTRPRLRDVIHFDHGWRRAKAKYGSEITVVKWQTPRQTMRPVSAARAWRLPEIESPAALAEWLMLDLTDLLWFTDLKGLEAKGCPPRTSHYHYIVQAKRSGGLRSIEAPRQRLKALQRQVLSQILEQIPPYPAAHGFVRERSIQTFVSPHLHKSVVLPMDLENFFPSFIGARVQTFFRILGYPETVANHLGGICTNATPRDVWTRAA